MDTTQFRDSIRTDVDAFVAAARLGLEQAVPSCPEWDVRALLGHLGDVHRWVTEILETRATERIRRDSSPAETEDPIAWFETGAAALLQVLESTPPDATVWNWAGAPPVAAFWSRRMSHETAIHRWDAQRAHGIATGFGPELAADGIAEMLEVILVFTAGRRQLEPIPATLHVHCTDVTGEWLVAMDGDGVAVRREHGKGDVAWRGSASDLFLAVTNRVPVGDASAIEVYGDPAVSARWADILRF